MTRRTLGLLPFFPLLLVPLLSFPQGPDQAEPTVLKREPPVLLGGQLSLQSSVGLQKPIEPFLSLRFIPELTFTLSSDGSSSTADEPSDLPRSSSPSGSSHGLTIDGEVSANAFASALFHPNGPASTDGALKPYRAWLRLSTARFEARAGLQKVSFGSATLFRPMMWFDTLDPRDPLQLTDGVWALLLRFYARGNANLWAWAMYGNDDSRGFDLAAPDDKTPEFGGRLQVPLFKGEIAATFHHRKAVIDGLAPILFPRDLNAPASPLPIAPVPEDRFGLDGKWDAGVGIWLEGALVHQRSPLLPFPYQLALNAGLDYTFGLGRGLTVLAEHFRLESSARAFSRGESLSFSALLVRYPLGLLDEISGIFYYDWKNRDVYRFASLKRTYDAVSLHLIAFWNPEELRVFPGRPGSASFVGKGLMILLAYHF